MNKTAQHICKRESKRIRKTLSDADLRLSQVQLRDSRIEDGLQIADMLAGATLDGMQGGPRFFNLIRGEVLYQEYSEDKTG